MAFAITPKPPIIEWLAELDASLQQSEKFFGGHPVALDLSAVSLSANAISQLVANLEERNIRILGIEGIDPAKWQVGLPSVLRGGRTMRSEDPEELSPKAVSPPGVTPQKQEIGIAFNRASSSLGTVCRFYRRGRYSHQFSRIRRGNRRRRLHSRLRRTSRTCASRRYRQCTGAHLLPMLGSRTSGNRYLLPNGRRY